MTFFEVEYWKNCAS